ncbi:MAG: hypothetical protein DRJ52_06770 [Thermoprotei archaeon]|nr:MAG: hypothetical protein DRJ52_06770 [Thermoprotei archaeon]RLF00362.1 MAG: hypothetical protein DRJ63_02775 [Thermoprotei archaeon]
MSDNSLEISALLDVMERHKRISFNNLIDGIITVAAFTIITFVAPWVFRTYFPVETRSFEVLYKTLQIGLLFLLLYICISRLMFMSWDLYRIAKITSKTILFEGIKASDYRKNSSAVKMYDLLAQEDKLVRRLLCIIAAFMTLTYIQSTEYFSEVIYTSSLPALFKSSPSLIILPLYVVMLFSLSFVISSLIYVREQLSPLMEELSAYTKSILSAQLASSTCPECGARIPQKAVHCPFCGFKVSTLEEKQPKVRES